MNLSKQWIVVYTRSKWEKKVAHLLTKKNIENYCPLNQLVRQWSDRKKVILEPLFTSYVFVRATKQEHALIKQIDGVYSLVHYLGEVAVVRDQEIEAIRNFLGEHSTVQLDKTPVRLNDEVRVINGPLMEQKGQVVCLKKNTVKVVLPSLGYIMSAEVKISNVEVISKAHSIQTV